MPHPEVVYGGTVRPPLPQAVTASGRQGHQISARFWKGHGGVGTRGSRKGWCRLRDSNTRPSHYECDALPTELRRHLRPDPPASGSGVPFPPELTVKPPPTPAQPRALAGPAGPQPPK